MFVFGSEMKALLSVAGVPRRLNETRVAEYFVPMFDDTAITFYEDIVRLSPATCMTVSPDGSRLRRYWALDPHREIRYRSDDDYADAFREIFTDAVRCRLRSAYPIGSMLSGGLDSSSVVCVARKLLAGTRTHQLHTFSAVFADAPECDESAYYNAVIAQGDLQPHYVAPYRVQPRADIGRLLDVHDEPFGIPYVFMYSALYGAAHDRGVRVLLDGMDGDSTVSHGVAYLTELAASGRWVQLYREVTAYARRVDRHPWAIVKDHVVRPLAPASVRWMWRMMRGRHRPAWATDSILNPRFARQIGLPERYARLRGDRLRPARTSREDHWQRLSWGIHPFLLEVLDRTAAGSSVEGRHVCYDVRLAEFCLALPGEQKLSNGWNRAVMRRAMSGLLPLAVRARGGKSDLSAAWIRALLSGDDGTADDQVAVARNVIGTYVDVEAFRRAHERYVVEGSQYDAVKVWWAIVLAEWLRGNEMAASRLNAA